MSKILIIEDDSEIRQLVVEELQDAGYETIEALNGPQGLVEIHAHSPDLVLCDIRMPDMDGYQVLTELRQDSLRYANIPFIFLSALADRKDVIVGKVRGGDDYITKPIDFDFLLVTVASHLRRMERMRASKSKAC